jgi:hypothetical protein
VFCVFRVAVCVASGSELVSPVCNMSLIHSLFLLALAGQSTAQLTGRGFPDCENGPLKSNKVCDTSAGTTNFGKLCPQ